MTPTQRLEDYCRRYGVDAAFGRRLLPLMERADRAAPEVRKRILELIEASFEKEASLQALRRKGEGEQERTARAEGRVLDTLANLLHSWDPPEWTLRWGDGTPPPGGTGDSDPPD